MLSKHKIVISEIYSVQHFNIPQISLTIFSLSLHPISLFYISLLSLSTFMNTGKWILYLQTDFINIRVIILLRSWPIPSFLVNSYSHSLHSSERWITILSFVCLSRYAFYFLELFFYVHRDGRIDKKLKKIIEYKHKNAENLDKYLSQ